MLIENLPEETDAVLDPLLGRYGTNVTTIGRAHSTYGCSKEPQGSPMKTLIYFRMISTGQLLIDGHEKFLRC